MKAKTHSKALNKFLAFIGVSALASYWPWA